MQDKADVLDAVARVAPPAAVSYLGLTSACLSNTVYVLTIVYILFQIIIMLPKVKNVFKSKDKRKEKNEEESD